MNHIESVFQAIASQDAEQIRAVFTEDAEWLSPPNNATAVALGAPHHMVGSTAIAHFFAVDFPRLFERDLMVAINGIHGDDKQVTAEATVTATLANGNHYSNDYCFVFELRGRLVHRAREYVDTARGNRMVFGEGPQHSHDEQAGRPRIT